MKHDLYGSPDRLHALAERAAQHPRIEAAVTSAVISAVRATLPGVIEALLAESADHNFGLLRIYRRKVPGEVRRQRDARVRALIDSGMAPDLVALEVGCSRTHVFAVRARAHRAQGDLYKTVP